MSNSQSEVWLIENGHIVCPTQSIDRVGRLLVSDGRIAALDPSDGEIPPGAHRVDAQGWMVLPGLIDIATELGEPGKEENETIESATMAALSGGYTTLACSAKTDPPIDTPSTVEFVRQKAARADRCRVHVIGCVSKNREGNELAEIGALVDAGAIAFSDVPNPLSNTALLRRALEYCLMFDRPILDRPEVTSLTRGGLMHEGKLQLVLALAPMPAEAEDLATSRDLRLLETTGGRLHLSSISTLGSVELLKRYKSRGSEATAGIRIGNLCFDDEMMRSFDSNLLVNPPLRSREHVESCLEALSSGTIDVLTTGHQPKALEKKMQELSAAPFGMSTLDTALAQAITYLVQPGHLSWQRLVEVTSTNPASVLGIDGGSLRVGAPADITLVDPHAEWTVSSTSMFSRSHNTPLLGKTLKGQTQMVWVGGRRKFSRTT